MSEIILCPRCERRLHLPADFQAELVRCPSCEAAFPITEGLPLPPLVRPAEEPSAARPSRDRRAPVEALRARTGRPGEFRRRSRGTCLVVALVAGVVLLFVGIGGAALVGLAWRARNTRLTYPVHVEADEEDEEDRREQLRQAFKDRPPLANDEITRQVQPLFDELAAALRAQDTDRIMAQFDIDRMIDEFAAAAGGGLPLRTARDRRDFRRGLHRGIGRSLTQRGRAFQWNATEIRTVKKLNNDEAVIIARHQHPSGVSLKMRWWVTRRNGEWTIYDFEDLHTGVRLSSVSVSLLGEGLDRAVEMARTARPIGEAMQALVRGDVDGAEKQLALVGGAQLPPRFEALRQLANGLVLLHRQKNADALQALEEAHRLQPDMPLTDFLRGLVLNRLDKPAEALKHLQAYRDLLGEDAEVCREIGEALRNQRRFKDAAREYRKALDFNPKEADAFFGLLCSLESDDNKDDLGPRFARLDNRRENFDLFAADCERRMFPALLDPLVQTMRRLDPDYPPVDYYQALVQARTGRPDEAVRSLRSALRKQTDKQKRQEYERHFLSVMALGGHYSKAYAAATDGQEAFRLLAAEAAKRYRLDELKRLMAVHARKYAADPLLPLYQAEIHVREGRYEKADKAFTAALARRPDAETLQTFRASRVLARYHTGQAMSAYGDIGPREETFEQLASLLFNDEEDAQLQALLDAHAREAPDSVELLRFRYRLLIRRKKTAEAVALFKSALAKTKDEDKQSEMVSEFLLDMLAADTLLEGYQAVPDAAEAFQQLARELVEDDRWDDLRRLLEAHRHGHAGDPWLAYYQAEIHLHDKEPDKAAKVLGEARKRAPKDVRNRIEYRYLFALYRAGHWERAYADIEPHDRTFTQLANLMVNDKKGAELQALVAVHRPHAPDSPDLPFYEARAKVLTQKWAEAISLFQRACRNQADKNARTRYQWSFLTDLAAAGRWLEGYRAAVDKDAALNTLGGQLVSQKKHRELAELLEEHRKGGGGEPWYSFYLGELHLLRGDAREATRHFAVARTKGAPTDQWRFRDGLFRARVRAGEAVVAYEEDRANEGTFGFLAQLCSQNKDLRQLQALLDAHRKVKPDDPDLVSWELELRWQKKDYEGALRLLAEHREDVFDQPRFRWKADNYRVRCLVKLKRGGEAVRAAEGIVKRRSGDRLLLVFAHAAAGDVPRTIAAMGELGERAYFVRRCYEDDDLGSILRSAAFQPFRAKFPEPKADRSAGEDDDP